MTPMRHQLRLGTALTLMLLPALAATAAGLPHTFSAGTPALAEEVNENFRYVAPLNVVYLNPVEGGDAQDNGAALLEALSPATLEAINGAPASANPYLIKLAPGIYDLGVAAAVLSPHVHLAGSGQGATRVQTNAPSYAATGGTITLASHSSVRGLTAQNTASSGTPVAILADGVTEAQVLDVELVVAGSAITHFGIAAANSAQLEADRVTIRHSMSGGNHIAVSSNDGATVLLNAVAIEMSGSADDAVGIESWGADITARNLVMTATNTNAGGQVLGLRAYGTGPDIALQDGRIRLSGAATRYPLWIASGTGRIAVNHSSLVNGDGTVNDYFLLVSAAGGSVRVGASQLGGSYYLSSGAGSVKCVHVYDADYDAATCAAAPF